MQITYLDCEPEANSTWWQWKRRQWRRCRAPSTGGVGGFSSPGAQSQSPPAPPSCPGWRSRLPARPAQCRRAVPSGSGRSTTWHNGARSAPRCGRCPARSRPVPPGRWWPLSSGRRGTRSAPGCCVATEKRLILQYGSEGKSLFTWRHYLAHWLRILGHINFISGLWWYKLLKYTKFQVLTRC